MIRKLQRAKGILLAFAFAVGIGAISTGQTATAEQMTQLPDYGRLTVEVIYHEDQGQQEAVDGMTLSLFRVADVKQAVSGNIDYSATADFKEADFDYAGMTATQSNQQAEKLEGLVKSKKLTTALTVVTDVNGRAGFEQLPKGVYLVTQTGKSQTAARYRNMQPFLVLVPMPEKSGDKIVWQSNVQATPKLKLVRPTPPGPSIPSTPPGHRPPDTGDDTAVQIWMIATLITAIVAGIAVYLILSKRK
ncbi:MAG: pilin N-terminal domain-containing protein [Eubacteriales bacterium]|nr:pilin N-terminal domain-containing protein [Eubacteriales bacterium]